MKQYLGLDCSTQGFKGTILDEQGIAEEESVNFGRDLPEYGSPSGFLANEDPSIVHANPLMWLDALDLLFEKMRKKGIRMENICGISGSAQQHGSVYLNERFESLLASLDPSGKLSDQIAPALSRPTSPIWMDHSTSEECRRLTERFGKRIQQVTGSGAAERFAGPQIMKFALQEPEKWNRTRRVHLISSFLSSVLAGKESPVDYGDGAGMNLLNLNTLNWDEEIASFTAPGLAEKLPHAVPSDTVAGTISPYFRKYGFRSGTPVVVWSGDNPCSLAGIGASEVGTLGISLGTSDTVFAPMKGFHTDPGLCGHVFGSRAGGFMTLICFANGSLVREKMRFFYGLSRAGWEKAFAETEPASGRVMLPFFEPECTPHVPTPCVRYNFDEKKDPSQTIRALAESQFLSMKLHSAWMGIRVRKLRLTGGASQSAALCQIAADVFQADAELLESTSSASLGAAMSAIHAVEKIPFSELEKTFCRPQKTVHPQKALAEKYACVLSAFEELLKKNGGLI